MAIGLEAAGGAMHVVFPRNSPIPNAKALAATSSIDGQSELVVRIYQGEHPEAAKNELLGEFTFGGVRPAPAGSVRLVTGSHAQGFDVTVYRTVIQHGKTIRKDSFASHYVPVGDTAVYGPGTKIPGPYFVIPTT